ncbi:MAG: YceI family protein [Alphaproteobacteria bacterium]|nr:YceI family protein [Alphaproteobacteria bacterium]
MMKSLFLAGALSLFANPVLAATWEAVPSSSALKLVGQQGANTITIQLPEWKAEIAFDPADLASSKLKISVAMASLTSETQNAADKAEEERELKGKSWFNVAANPEAVFESTAISAKGDRYQATGNLTLRGVTMPATLDFAVAINGSDAEATGSAVVSWPPFGMGWDPAQSGIKPEVKVEFRVVAKKAP